MPSSTSSSNSPPGRAAVAALLGLLFLLVAGVELVTRAGFDRTSRIATRTRSEYDDAVSKRTERPQLLVVGNSLLDAAVDMEQLRASAPAWDIRRFVVDDTSYYDWYFGLQRLFADGAKPDVVAVMLTPPQATVASIRGEFSAHHLLRGGDILEAGRILELHPTKTSSLLAGHWSKFYGVRVEIRKFLLWSMMPGLRQLTPLLTPRKLPDIDDALFERIARERLPEIREVTVRHGARLLWITPPLLETPDGTAGLKAAADATGVPLLIPIPSGELPASLYRDGYHLNSDGASRYTARLAGVLVPQLNAIDLK
jgi:hypothetical protein